MAFAFLEVVRCLFAGCSSRARNGDAASVAERRRRLVVAGVDATASGRVAGCALRARDVVVAGGGVLSRGALGVAVFLEVEAALRGAARVRLLARVSTVTTSSVISAAAARRVRRVDIVLQ